MAVQRRDPMALAGRPCAVACSLELVGERWALVIIREVMFGNHRFTQIAHNTGAPRDRLAARLRTLVEEGILERRLIEEGARHEGYFLTEAGEDLRPVIRTLLAWGDKWAVTTTPLRVYHRDHELALRTHCATCGEAVDDADLHEEMLAPGWDMQGRVTTAMP
ncbi:DNA-binding HxlR family transcriptional regulator [Streptomyces aurantiacus]|uniref:winged helix-turn-helix transcriptional regulator n=1 Tax=Streptomyces aurantiacus TaxID=47760 RepID=UPI002792008A|nr:helix-turn-helix domain-containing protein [Streptomyces aurantiacus]MDQ0779020.1 DNA-binding HxlR family transcriptional regulator [Streptomyces aurantiacus]